MALATWLLLSTLTASVVGIDISVRSSGGNKTSPTSYGLMHEDINHAGDGGIYAELIQNRAFQGSDAFPASLTAWEPVNGTILSLQNLPEPLSAALPTSMRVEVGSATGEAGFSNAGYWGIEVKAQKYTGSFYVKGAYHGTFTASLHSNTTGETLGSVAISSAYSTPEWTQHNFTLTAGSAAPDVNNTFHITFDASMVTEGSLDFNLISLFPPTYNGRQNGNRRDLMEALAELNPKFLRFPGGSDLEGVNATQQWKWNETIGPLKDRPGRTGAWGYYETNGLGLVEYLNWCTDLEVEPILAVFSGLHLSDEVISENDLQPYVQDALNEIEFVTGSVDTEYGALRASLGYPKPWPLRYVEIGNEDNLENGLQTYTDYRFPAFYQAITDQYPDITVIASTSSLALPDASAGDYHDYNQPDGFVNRFNFFDQFAPGNETLIGEYATIYPNSPDPIPFDNVDSWPDYPFWIGAVAEAVFLIGAERNADRVIGATYAPILKNVNSYIWPPTLISFSADSSLTSRSTSWHVLKLLSTTHITDTLPATSPDAFGPLYYVAGYDNETDSHIFKAAVYNSTGEVPIVLTFEGLEPGAIAELTILVADGPYATDSPGSREVVNTQTRIIRTNAVGAFEFSLPNLGVAVLSTAGSCELAYHRKSALGHTALNKAKHHSIKSKARVCQHRELHRHREGH